MIRAACKGPRHTVQYVLCSCALLFIAGRLSYDCSLVLCAAGQATGWAIVIAKVSHSQARNILRPHSASCCVPTAGDAHGRLHHLNTIFHSTSYYEYVHHTSFPHAYTILLCDYLPLPHLICALSVRRRRPALPLLTHRCTSVSVGRPHPSCHRHVTAVYWLATGWITASTSSYPSPR